MKYLVALALVVLLHGCDASPDVETAEAPPENTAAEEPVTQEPELLPTPFTPEQIRDEWIEGLTLVMETTTPDGTTRERWTVVAADADGADIEFTPLDAEGAPAGEPKIERSAWTALRDHAKYPTDVASREQVTRDTALGQLEGWLYRIQNEGGGETEVFFARELPGAPLEMIIARDGNVAMSVTQVERQRPAVD